jgi:glutaredoxin 3
MVAFSDGLLPADGPKIKALLTRLTGQGTFPNVVVGGKPLGGADRTGILHESGGLKKRLQKAGAI